MVTKQKIERDYWWWAQYAEKKMKPCPFCGGKGSFNVNHVLGSLVYIVYCAECGVEKHFGESKWKDAVNGWDFTEQQIYRGLSAKALLFWNIRGG